MLGFHEALIACRAGISIFTCPLLELLVYESYILAIIFNRRARSGFFASPAKSFGKDVVDRDVGDAPNAFGNPSNLCDGSKPCQARVGGGGGVRDRRFFWSGGVALLLVRTPAADEAERIDQVK